MSILVYSLLQETGKINDDGQTDQDGQADQDSQTNQDGQIDQDSRTDDQDTVDIISYWHPNLTINVVDDQSPWQQGSIPPPLDKCIHIVI